jgi:acyl-CoA thioesterase
MAGLPKSRLPMTLHSFDEAIALTPRDDNSFTGCTSPAYANMVGPFGGTTAATMLQAALQHPERIGQPIALTVNFASAVAEGEFQVHARAARTNRSTQHWLIEMVQQGQTVSTASAVFAQRRSTWSRPEAMPPEEVPAPETLRSADTSRRPAWVRRYDMRFIEGGMPEPFDAVEQPHSRTCAWVRDEPARSLDHASLAALCDSFFPRVFIRRRKPAPIGTVTMTTYFHADEALLAAQADRHVLCCARAMNFRDGYFDQSAEVWSDSRELLASTHQMVYFRE